MAARSGRSVRRGAALAAVAGVVLVLASVAAAAAPPAPPTGAWFDGWFRRSFSVDVTTVEPGARAAERSTLRVGPRAVSLAGAQADVPFVVLYRFADDRVDLHMLDPVSQSVITVAFDPGAEPVELDLIALGSLLVPPGDASHPCRTHPAQAACEEEGREEIDGEVVERWRVHLADGFGFVEAFVLWAGRDGLVRRIRYTDGTQIDLTGYDLGPQPEDAFTIPDEYDRR